MKHYIFEKTGIGAFALLFPLASLLFCSCSNDEEESSLTPAVIPSSITFNLPEDIERLIYTDATGASVYPMLKGETVTLDYTLEPDSATFTDVIWTSTNEDAATVDDNGTVTAVSGDDYSIVQVAPVGLYSGSGISATLKIQVSNSLVQAESLTISASSYEVYAGNTIQLSVSVLPSDATYKTVSWSSDNEDVAAISADGVLTAKASSQASTPVTVTATALDGSGVTAKTVINVLQIVQPQSITIDQTYSADGGYACAIGEKTLTLSYTTVPAECTTSLIEWTTSDATIATVSDGVVTFNQDGNFGNVVITATCPETGNSGSVTLNLAAGLIRETFHNENFYSWYNASQSANGTSSSHEWHDGYLTITTYTVNTTTQRADIKCWNSHSWFHAGNYPIFAFRMDDVKDKGATSRNINIDAVGTSASGTTYKAIANGNNKYLHDYQCSDGSHVFIYDLSQQECGTGGLMPTGETVDFTTLQIKYADMKGLSAQIQYNLYWVQTFKSLDEAVDYITNVDNLTYEIIK